MSEAFNPYGYLGLTREATVDQIKEAWREAAAKYHPDNQKTGNATIFMRAKRAADCLLDPETRAHYDATGEVREGKAIPPPDPERGAILQVLQNVIDAVVTGGAKTDEGDLETTDVVMGVLEMLKGQERNLQKQEREAQRQKRRTNILLRKLKAPADSDDPLSALLRTKLTNIQTGLDGVAKALAIHQKVVAIWKGYVYEGRDPFEGLDIPFGQLDGKPAPALPDASSDEPEHTSGHCGDPDCEICV